MAPGDKQFHLVSQNENKSNLMKTYASREEANKAYEGLGNLPKLLMSGETGDIL